MRDISAKVDGVDTLPAAAFNSDQNELENIVTSADITLDPNAGPDTDLNMLSKAVAAYANAGNTYQDSGAADAYVLSIASNLKSVTKYYDNMTIVFKAGNTNTGASTVNINALGVKSVTLPDGTALGAGDISSGAYVIAVYNLSSDRFELAVKPQSGQTIQTVHVQDGALNSGSTALPIDNTTPQNTEGNQYMSATITPTSASSKLVIEATLNFARDLGSDAIVAAIFQDATVNALSVAYVAQGGGSSNGFQIKIRYEIVSGTTSATTFKIRVGGDGTAILYFNGDSSGNPLFNGLVASTMTVTEKGA